MAPPHIPYPHAWLAAGVDLRQLAIIQAAGRDALWAAEQCLRSGSCGAVLCWPKQADDRALRRLQVAAETGQTLAFAYRPLREAVNPSPAALRLALEANPHQLRVLKCRGGLAPAQPIPAAGWC
ncbi:SOS cell division inhibitor [compost metagenome]